MTDFDAPPITFQETMALPHSPSAEEAVLGSVIIDPEVLVKIGNLPPEDFYIVRNRFVWVAILDLRRRGQDIDYLTICAELDKNGRLHEIGGQSRIMQLVNHTATSMHAESYAEIVREKAKRRRILETAKRLSMAAFDETCNLDSAVSTGMDALSRSIISSRGAVHVSQYVSEIYDEVDAASRNPVEIFGISTGLDDWDRITYGLQKGEVVRLSGEPGLGKSLLLFQILSSVAEAGHPVALYELEMSAKQVVRRQVSARSRITTYALRSGKITDEQVPQFTHAIECMERLPIYISDASNMTTADLRVDLQRLIDYHGVEVVGIDYEALLADAGANENERRNIISDRVHAITKDLNLATISIGDMTKAGIRGEQKGQGSMAGTAHELHNADSIVIMRRVDNNPNLVSLCWEKLREGDSDRQMQLVKLPGLPAFGPATSRPITQEQVSGAGNTARFRKGKGKPQPMEEPEWNDMGDLEL